MRRRVRVALIVFVVILAGAVLAIALWTRRGFSAREEPTRVEAFVARRLRRLSIPRSATGLKNPVPLDQKVLSTGMAHFADHCAICHANDGSGDTQIGRNLYPKSPDMRLPATQSLSDGELFYIIENGVRLTGMPAWGTGAPESAHDSWALVHFIRHLPRLTPAELEEMERLNPKPAEELAQEKEIESFLGGDLDDEEKKRETKGKSPHKH